jgi:hypothetical protein
VPGAFSLLEAAQIVARNIVPLAGILFLGWSAQNVLIVYFVDTLLAMAVLFAGVLRKLAPPIEDDGWAARINGEFGMVGGGVFVALFMAIPLGLPMLFMMGWRADWAALAGDRQLHVGLLWQCAAAVWSYVGLYRALRTATPEALRLKRRFALVFLRWMALVIVAYSPLPLVLGSHGPLVFVAIYVAISVWAEIAPDHFLRLMPGGAEDAEPPARIAQRPRKRRS